MGSSYSSPKTIQALTSGRVILLDICVFRRSDCGEWKGKKKPMLSPKLDPVVRQLLLDMEAQNNPPMESVPVEETRQQVVERFRPVGGVPEPMASVEDRRIP